MREWEQIDLAHSPSDEWVIVIENVKNASMTLHVNRHHFSLSYINACRFHYTIAWWCHRGAHIIDMIAAALTAKKMKIKSCKMIYLNVGFSQSTATQLPRCNDGHKSMTRLKFINFLRFFSGIFLQLSWCERELFLFR